MTAVYIEVTRQGTIGMVICGLSSFWESQHEQTWQDFITTALTDYVQGTDMLVIIDANTNYDLFSQLCTAGQISFWADPQTRTLVRMTVHQRVSDTSELLGTLVGSTEWDMDGHVVICARGAIIRPETDGTAIHWIGPADAIDGLVASLRSTSRSHRVELGLINAPVAIYAWGGLSVHPFLPEAERQLNVEAFPNTASLAFDSHGRVLEIRRTPRHMGSRAIISPITTESSFLDPLRHVLFTGLRQAGVPDRELRQGDPQKLAQLLRTHTGTDFPPPTIDLLSGTDTCPACDVQVCPPIVVYKWGKVIIHSSIEDAERDLSTSAADDKHYLAFDSAGRILDHHAGIQVATAESSFAPQLKHILRTGLRHAGLLEQELETATLPQLLELARVHHLSSQTAQVPSPPRNGFMEGLRGLFRLRS